MGAKKYLQGSKNSLLKLSTKCYMEYETTQNLELRYVLPFYCTHLNYFIPSKTENIYAIYHNILYEGTLIGSIFKIHEKNWPRKSSWLAQSSTTNILSKGTTIPNPNTHNLSLTPPPPPRLHPIIIHFYHMKYQYKYQWIWSINDFIKITPKVFVPYNFPKRKTHATISSLKTW